MMYKRITLISWSEDRVIPLATQLAEHGYEVAGCHPRAITETESTNRADLALLYVDATHHEDLSTLENLREQFSREDLPIFVISERDDIDHQVRALGAGANDYLLADTPFPVLFARIRAILVAQAELVSRIDHACERVMRESIGAACHHLSQPITVASAELEMLLNQGISNRPSLVNTLQHVRSQLYKSGEVLNQLRSTMTYVTEQYVNETNILHIECVQELA